MHMIPFQAISKIQPLIKKANPLAVSYANAVPDSVAKTNNANLTGLYRNNASSSLCFAGIILHMEGKKKFFPSNPRTIAPYLPFFYVALLTCSLVVVSLHNHPVMKAYATCAICRVVHDLTSGDQPAAFLLTLPGILATDVVIARIRQLTGIFVTPKSTRGPP